MKGKKIIIPAIGLTLGISSLASCGTNVVPFEEKVVMTELNVNKFNAKTEYIVGEEFSSNNLVVTAIYSDFSRKPITNYKIDATAFDKDVVGDYNIYISYQEGTNLKVSSYTVSVKSIVEEQTPYLLGITAEGIKTDYQAGQDLDLTGLKVYANYSDLTSEDITSSVTKDFSGFDKTKKGVYELKFSYSKTYTKGSATQTKLAETFILVKVDAKPVAISFIGGTTNYLVDTMNDQPAASVGMSLIDTSDWKFNVVYKTGQKEVIDSEDISFDEEASQQADGSYKVGYNYSYNGVTVSGQDAKFNARFNNILKATSFINAGDLDVATISADTELNDRITLLKSTAIDANNAKLGSLEFTKRIKLSGKGSTSQRALVITTEKAAKVLIYARSSSSSEDRPLAIFNSENKELDSEVAYGGMTRIEFNVDAAGTYYIYGTTNAVNIYYIGIFE